eukprot:Skav231430  [mRNA]  locus=scaffold330:163792:164019:+ [translate_table: standard]
MDFPRISQGFLKDFPWISHGSTLDCPWISSQDNGIQLVDHEAISLARAYGQYKGAPARRAHIDVSQLLLAMEQDG